MTTRADFEILSREPAAARCIARDLRTGEVAIASDFWLAMLPADQAEFDRRAAQTIAAEQLSMRLYISRVHVAEEVPTWADDSTADPYAPDWAIPLSRARST